MSIQFNKPPSSKPQPDTFSDPNPHPPGAPEAASFNAACRSMRRSRLLSSDAPYTMDDVAFLKDSMEN